jgi:hypothetical protein
MARLDILGEVVRDAGLLHVVIADRERARRWRGAADDEPHAAALEDRAGVVVGKDKALALVDLGGAGQALAVRAARGIVLAAYFPRGKVSSSVRQAIAEAAAGEPIDPQAVGTVRVTSGISLGWGFDAFDDEWLQARLPPGRYGVHVDGGEIEGKYGSIDCRVFIVPDGTKLRGRPPQKSDAPSGVVGSVITGTGEILVVVAPPAGALAFGEDQVATGYAKVKDKNGACMVEAGGVPCAYVNFKACNEVHVVRRDDGAYVVTPAFPARGHGHDVDLSAGFVDDALAPASAPVKVGTVTLPGELVVAWAHENALKPKHLEALRKTGAAQRYDYGVALAVPEGKYDVWFEKKKRRGDWGSADARVFLTPQGRKP